MTDLDLTESALYYVGLIEILDCLLGSDLSSIPVSVAPSQGIVVLSSLSEIDHGSPLEADLA